jgi:hypothetical protein
MNLTECKKILDETGISDEYFLRLHFCVEAIIRRLFLIGLRLKGMQFRTAQSFVDEYHPRLRDHIRNVFGCCGVDYDKLLASEKYATLEKLFFEFTSRWRNQRVHGLYPVITDTELLKLLITADKSFINEIEAMLKKMGKPSLFDTPGKWGATRGKTKDVAAVCKEIFGKKSSPKPLSSQEAADMLKGIKLLK